MTSTPVSKAESSEVVVRMPIAAEVATVWTFLSDGERFARWIGAWGGGPPLPGTAVDPRVGGAIRVCYPGENGAGSGQFEQIEPMRRVVFTWGYENGQYGMSAGATRIEITLSPTSEGTLVELRHRGLPSEEARRGHQGGWIHYLSMLSREAAAAHYAEALPRVFEAYFKAWSEVDEAARTRLLEQCCEPQVRLRGSFACTNDLAELSAHIANGQKQMPGMRLSQDGPPQQMHGFAQVPWSVRGPDGTPVFRGVNFAMLSPRGRLATIVSFPAAAGQ